MCIYLQCLKSHLKCKTDNESPFWANLHLQLLNAKRKAVDYNDTDFLFYFRISTNQLTTNILIKHFALLGNFGAHSLYKHIVFSDFKGHIFSVIHGCITPVSCHAQNIFFSVNFLYTIDFSRAKIWLRTDYFNSGYLLEIKMVNI